MEDPFEDTEIERREHLDPKDRTEMYRDATTAVQAQYPRRTNRSCAFRNDKGDALLPIHESSVKAHLSKLTRVRFEKKEELGHQQDRRAGHLTQFQVFS